MEKSSIADILSIVGIEEMSSVSSVEVFRACVHCNRKLIQVSGGLIAQCDKCGHAMKLSKCEEYWCPLLLKTKTGK